MKIYKDEEGRVVIDGQNNTVVYQRTKSFVPFDTSTLAEALGRDPSDIIVANFISVPYDKNPYSVEEAPSEVDA